MPITPSTVWRKLQGLYLSALATPLSAEWPLWGSGIATQEMTRNATANTPMATNSSGVTAWMVVSRVSWPMRAPTKNGVRVPDSELSAPPVWMSWLPLLPPPPSRLSIGLTTVLSIHTQKPHTNAPSRYTMKLRHTLKVRATSTPFSSTTAELVNTVVSAPTTLDRYWMNRPTMPTAMAHSAVFL